MTHQFHNRLLKNFLKRGFSQIARGLSRIVCGQRRGMTLLELSIGAAVLIVALVGLLVIFFRNLALNENSRDLTLAIYAIQEKLEEIRNTTFSAIYSTYNGMRFEPAGFSSEDAEGSISINNSNPNLLQVSIEVSWRESTNRVVGEDKNLNGLLDAGEDLNGNVQIDSPARVVTLMAQR